MEERTGIDRVRAITRYSCVYTSILCQASILHASQTRQNTVAHSMRSDASLIRRLKSGLDSQSLIAAGAKASVRATRYSVDRSAIVTASASHKS